METIINRLTKVFYTAVAENDIATIEWCWLTAHILFDHHQPISTDERFVGTLDAIKSNAAILIYMNK